MGIDIRCGPLVFDLIDHTPYVGQPWDEHLIVGDAGYYAWQIGIDILSDHAHVLPLPINKETIALVGSLPVLNKDGRRLRKRVVANMRLAMARYPTAHDVLGSGAFMEITL